MIQIRTAKSFYIIVTIKYLQFNASFFVLNLACEYGGVSAFNINNTIHTTISTTYDSELSSPFDIFKNRNVYSETSSLVIVIYNYKDYYAMRGTLHLSTTQCNVVKVNVCTRKHTVYFSSSAGMCTIHQLTHNMDIFFYQKAKDQFCSIQSLRYDESRERKKQFVEVNVKGYLKGKI